MKKKKQSPWIVLLAIVLGILIGSFFGPNAHIAGIQLYPIYDLIGKLFINALKLIVVPLVSASIITGIARIGSEGAVGRLGLKMFGFYLGTSLLAILIGLTFVNLLEPGASFIAHGHGPDGMQAVPKNFHLDQALSMKDVILQLIPTNIVVAFQGQMLGLIVVSLLFGYALTKIEHHAASALITVWQGVFQTMLVITEMIMFFLPLGVFCLVAKSFADSGIESLRALALFVLTVLLGLATFGLIALPLLLKMIARVNPLIHFKAMAPALVTAFSTSSSSATLPVTIDCVEKRAGVSNRICSLVIPLGSSINMSGSALYECVAAMFIAQVYGVEMSFATQFSVVLLSLMTSIGIAGIPSASIVGILVILNAIGLPAEGIGMLFAVDRLLDMCRTTINVFSDSCCAILVACTEGEQGVLTKQSFA